jgi:hypothetical protein
MKKIIALCLLAVFVNGTQAQLFKKLKDKANQALNKAGEKVISKKEKTSESKTEQSTANEAPQPAKTKSSKGGLLAVKAIDFNSTKPLKVTVAWGRYKDAEGNRYGVETYKYSESFKYIYKVTPKGEVFSYFDFEKNNLRRDEAIPVMDKNGNFYIVSHDLNGYGSKIYRLTKEGILEELAGNYENKDIICDGKKTAVKINEVLGMYPSKKEDAIYFTCDLYAALNRQHYKKTDFKTMPLPTEITNDKYIIIRKLTPDGVVETLKDKDGVAFVCKDLTDIAEDNDGNLICATHKSYVYKVIPSDKIIKILGTPDPYDNNGEGEGNKVRWILGDAAKARLPQPSEIIFNAKNELIIFDHVTQRFVKYDGKTVTAFSGTSKMESWSHNISGAADVEKDVDGIATKAQYINPHFFALDEKGNVLFITDTGVRQLAPDGSVTTILRNNK